MVVRVVIFLSTILGGCKFQNFQCLAWLHACCRFSVTIVYLLSNVLICMSILPICMSVSWADNVQEGQKRASDGSQGTDGCELTCFWEQQPKNGFSARIISTCEHWDISPFPSTLVFDLKSLSKLGAYWISSLLGSHAFSDAKTSVGPIKTHYLLKTPFNL